MHSLSQASASMPAHKINARLLTNRTALPGLPARAQPDVCLGGTFQVLQRKLLSPLRFSRRPPRATNSKGATCGRGRFGLGGGLTATGARCPSLNAPIPAKLSRPTTDLRSPTREQTRAAFSPKGCRLRSWVWRWPPECLFLSGPGPCPPRLCVLNHSQTQPGLLELRVG